MLKIVLKKRLEREDNDIDFCHPNLAGNREDTALTYTRRAAAPLQQALSRSRTRFRDADPFHPW